MLTRIRIIDAFLILFGIIYPTQATTIKVTITSFEPKTGVAFDGDVVTLTCEASDDVKPPNITWHLQGVLAPFILNSSFTKITSKIEGNKTIGVLTTTTSIANGRPNGFYIYCKGSIGSSAKQAYQYFTYVKERPSLQVNVPRTQIMAEGTKRHVLHCEVSSNVDVESLTLYWIYAGEILQEETIKLKKGKPVSRPILLQCLMEKDFGDYECAVNTTLYHQTWHDSVTTTLKSSFLGNAGSNINPTIIHFLCWPLILLWNMF